METKVDVWIICGGRSAEHEVSLCSARSIASSLDRARYDLHFVTITKGGKWESGPLLEGVSTGALQRPAPPSEAYPSPPVRWEGLKGLVEKASFPGIEAAPVDGDGQMVVFPVLHGPYGEDGTIQGLLEMLDIPYVGSGVLGSALAMDKAKSKEVLFHKGIPVPRWVSFNARDGNGARGRISRTVEKLIGYPCFVKPANLGSSVGITKAKTLSELDEAIDRAAKYDTKVLIEEAINAREIECSVLGNEHPVASVPGEIVPGNEFYDYEAKYAEAGTELIIPAELSQEQMDQVRRLAIRAFQALECCGMARVDFFLDKKTGRIVVNELNTIPGFTQVSMYPKLWEASGVPYAQLLDKLIELGLERHEERKGLAVNRD